MPDVKIRTKIFSINIFQVYQWKLLNHVSKDHGKTLKPAHLSYKCTVCTATFGQYKLFENHVYTAHRYPSNELNPVVVLVSDYLLSS